MNAPIAVSRDHLLRPLLRAVEEHGDEPLLAHRRGNSFCDLSSVEVWDRVQRFANGLLAIGVHRGDRVAVMGKTSLEWMLADLAINTVGAVTVPIYETSSASQVEWILRDSGARLLIVGSDRIAELAAPLVVAAPDCIDTVVNVEAGGIEAVQEMGKATEPGALEQRLDALAPQDLATIIYTSGTTGRPKGCALTHANLRANVEQIVDALQGTVNATDSCLLFLPLAHVLAKMTALFCLEQRIKIAFGTSVARLPEEFRMAQPTLIAAVPRIFEKVHATAHRRAEADRKGAIFDRATKLAVRWSRENASDGVRTRTRLEHALYDRLVYSKMREAFGGKLRMAFSGGAPLGERLTSFFDGTGIRIYEGYGLTETSPILTLSHTDNWSPGAAGTPVKDTQIQLGDDGEILAKGPQVFSGYWNNPDATAEVFDPAGWFHTGDIGEIDDQGFLRIVGRSKDIIVTAAGKNVAPAPLEDALRSNGLISQALVLGDGRPFVSALITLDAEMVENWRAHHESDELRDEIQHAVDHANELVSRAESIRKFEILPHDFDLDSEELTPTLKVRRSVVEDHYRDAIDKMYAP